MKAGRCGRDTVQSELTYAVKRKSVCLMHNEAKQYQNAGIWSRERSIAGSCKTLKAHALKTSNSPKVSNKAPIQERQKARASEASSWHQVKVKSRCSSKPLSFSILKRKGKGQCSTFTFQGPGPGQKEGVPMWAFVGLSQAHSLSPPTSAQVQLRRQISADGALRARPPALPSCHH